MNIFTIIGVYTVCWRLHEFLSMSPEEFKHIWKRVKGEVKDIQEKAEKKESERHGPLDHIGF